MDSASCVDRDHQPQCSVVAENINGLHAHRQMELGSTRFPSWTAVRKLRGSWCLTIITVMGLRHVERGVVEEPSCLAILGNEGVSPFKNTVIQTSPAVAGVVSIRSEGISSAQQSWRT